MVKFSIETLGISTLRKRFLARSIPQSSRVDELWRGSWRCPRPSLRERDAYAARNLRDGVKHGDLPLAFRSNHCQRCCQRSAAFGRAHPHRCGHCIAFSNGPSFSTTLDRSFLNIVLSSSPPDIQTVASRLSRPGSLRQSDPPSSGEGGSEAGPGKAKTSPCRY